MNLTPQTVKRGVSAFGLLALLTTSAVAQGIDTNPHHSIICAPPGCQVADLQIQTARYAVAWPPMTPAEAVAVLQRDHLASDMTLIHFGWDNGRSGATGAKGPDATPWAWPAEAPARRLDGTLLSQPPAVYGLPFWGWSGLRRPIIAPEPKP